MLDVTEVANGTDPTDPCSYLVGSITEPITAGVDCDGDGVLDVTEVANGTDPNDPCSYNVADITVAITAGVDCDGDGVLDITEVANGTDPTDPCSYNVADITEQITEQRVIAINQLAQDVEQVSELFTDMALLVNEQGENIDNIQTNIENSDTNIHKATHQLVKANTYQKRKRRCAIRCVCFLTLGITISSIILIIKISIQNNK